MPGETENQSEYNPERPPIEFNQENWEEALAGVFARAATDPKFRYLCLTDARAAVHEVAPDLALPADFKVLFVDKREEVLHTYLLPTPLPIPPLANDSLQRYTKEAADSFTASWTGPGTPHGTHTGKHCPRREGDGRSGEPQ